MKKYMLILLCTCLAVSVAACANKNERKESPTPELPPASVSEDGSSMPDSEETPIAYNEALEKYYDYFSNNSHTGMLLGNETKGEGFSDAEMAAYALCELILQSDGTYEQAVGFPKEDIDAVTEKYFGANIKKYENRISTVIPGTGYITSTGWGGSSAVLVLKELRTDLDGISTGVFYQFNFGMDGFRPTTKDDLLQGKFENYEQLLLTTIIFEEKTDENGEMYLRYYKISPEGEAKPPYTIYQG